MEILLTILIYIPVLIVAFMLISSTPTVIQLTQLKTVVGTIMPLLTTPARSWQASR